MRGRLIFRFYAEIFPFDPSATEHGVPTGGFDPDFRETIVVGPDTQQIGERLRQEHAALRIPCQIEPESWEALEMFAAGEVPHSRLDLLFHFRHLEALGLVDPISGAAGIRVGDRLAGVLDAAGERVLSVATPPGLYVQEVRPMGFGLHLPRPRRNLLLVTVGERASAAPRAAGS
jgi:hypothetical protein